MINFDPYSTLRLEGKAKVLPMPPVSGSIEVPSQFDSTDGFLPSGKTKFLYYINKLTGIYCLYISQSIAPEILAIADRKRHLGFFYCYKIIKRFEFI